MPAIPRATNTALTRASSVSNGVVNNTSSRSSSVPTSAAEAAWMSGNEAAIEEFIDGFMPGESATVCVTSLFHFLFFFFFFFFFFPFKDTEWALASELLDKKLEEFAEEPIIIIVESKSINVCNHNQKSR
jgi:hypothetical protein